MPQANRPASATAVLILVVVLGAIWLAIGLLIAFGIHPGMRLAPVSRTVMSILCISAACAAMVMAFALKRRSRFGYVAALAFLAVTTLAVFFDQVGWADLIFLAVNLVPLVLLIRDRSWYLES